MDEHDGISIRTYIERLMDERDRQYELRYRAQEAALQMATAEMERRLAGLNELRREVIEDRGKFVTRELFDAELAPLKDLRSKALLIGGGVAIFAGLIGAMIGRALGG